MKRSSTILNETNEKVVKEDTIKMKSVYYSSDIDDKNAPYYDPYDIHIHKWVKGFMNNPQDHNDPQIQKNNRYTFNSEVMYCSVCHEINYDCPFPMKNDTNIIHEGLNIDIETGLLNCNVDNYNQYSKILQTKINNSVRDKKKIEIKDNSIFMSHINNDTDEWVKLV